MQKEINLPSEIEIFNPRQIIDVHIYPVVCKGNNTLEIVIYATNGNYFLRFVNKEDAKKSLTEIYSSMVHRLPLFIIRYNRDCCGEVIKSDEVVTGGMQLTCIQKALENLKKDK